jgi:uncharacterized membrane-anchored protein
VAVAVAATSLTQLFFDRSVGLADNGDGGRLMCRLGLRAAQNTPFRSPQWDYVGVNGSPECHVVPLYRAYTDWAYVIHPVSWLYRNTVGGGHFDLRVLGFLDSAILGLLVGGLFLAWPGSRRRKTLVCAAVSLVVLDIGFLAYFNSPLSDPAGLLGLLALLVAGVWLAGAPRVGVRHRVAVALAAAFTALDKPQLITVTLLALPVLLWRPGRRLAGAALAVCLVALTVGYAGMGGAGFAQGNAWDLTFGAVLADSPHPAQDLRDLGMDPALAHYAGSSAWAGSGWFDPAFLRHKSRLTQANTAVFLLEHPRRAAHLFHRAVSASALTRLPYLGNYYDPATTTPLLTSRPDPATKAFWLLRPVAWPLFPLLWVGAAAVGLWEMARSRRRVWGVALYLTGGGALLLCATALGDGYFELVKHEVFAAFLSALTIAVAGAAVVARLAPWVARSPSSGTRVLHPHLGESLREGRRPLGGRRPSPLAQAPRERPRMVDSATFTGRPPASRPAADGVAWASKVPEVTVWFWITKVLTTGMGETTSDFLANINPALAVLVGAGGLALFLRAQLRATRYVPWIYWGTVVMVSVFGTVVADGIHLVGVSYWVTTPVFAAALAAVLWRWQRSEGTLSIHSIVTARREKYYWGTVLATFALGTAAGDLTADSLGWGFLASGILFAVVIAVPAVATWKFGLSSIAGFWAAYIVTRPLGASFADWLGDKPDRRGALGWGTGPVSLVALLMIVGLVWYLTVSRVDVDVDADQAADPAYAADATAPQGPVSR